jgi:hypothetical protein
MKHTTSAVSKHKSTGVPMEKRTQASELFLRVINPLSSFADLSQTEEEKIKRVLRALWEYRLACDDLMKEDL